MKVLRFLFLGSLAAAIVACGWRVTPSGPRLAMPTEAQNTFTAVRLLAVSDADMAATAYADGRLFPVDGPVDTLFVIDDPATASGPSATYPVSNTVMGWPGPLAMSPDGRMAYVISGRMTMPREVARVDSVFDQVPVDTRLFVIDLDAGSVVAETTVCPAPMSVDVAPDGAFLLIACQDRGGELAVVPLVSGRPLDPRIFDLDLPSFSARPFDNGPTYAALHPSGEAAGVIVENRAVTLVRFTTDDAGVPRAAVAETPIQAGKWLSVARWTRRGAHLLVADVGWGPRPTDAVFNGPGTVLSLALSPEDKARGVVSAAKVSLSPEAIELNGDGDLLVAVNMERTYLPGGIFRIFKRRDRSSLSLVAVDDLTGSLATLGRPVGFRGVLPEDAVFDRDGDQLAVAVFQDHDAPRSGGWIEFFDIVGEGDTRRPVPTGRRLTLPRGIHDLALHPGATPAP